VFSVRSVPRCYKQDSWRNDLVERQSPPDKNMSSEAEDGVGILQEATTGAYTADLTRLHTCCSKLQTVCYNLQVFNKFDFQSNLRLQSLCYLIIRVY
jgi:hypothetical protein